MPTLYSWTPEDWFKSASVFFAFCFFSIFLGSIECSRDPFVSVCVCVSQIQNQTLRNEKKLSFSDFNSGFFLLALELMFAFFIFIFTYSKQKVNRIKWRTKQNFFFLVHSKFFYFYSIKFLELIRNHWKQQKKNYTILNRTLNAWPFFSIWINVSSVCVCACVNVCHKQLDDHYKRCDDPVNILDRWIRIDRKKRLSDNYDEKKTTKYIRKLEKKLFNNTIQCVMMILRQNKEKKRWWWWYPIPESKP